MSDDLRRERDRLRALLERVHADLDDTLNATPLDSPDGTASGFEYELRHRLKTIIEAVKPGDVVALQAQGCLTNAEFDCLRQNFNEAHKRGQLPKDVTFLVLEHGLELRRLQEEDRRALLDKLCTSLGMRAVPLEHAP